MMESCTREGDLCADFFCGSGTLAAVAAAKKRRFIACDSGRLAVESTISRLSRFNSGDDFWQRRRFRSGSGVSGL